MRVLVTDAEYGVLDIEADVLAAAGHELLTARCRTAADVIAAAQDVDAVIVQYAPITAEVLEALSRLRLVSRYGVGVDVVDTDAARARGSGCATCPTTGPSRWRCTRSRCCWRSCATWPDTTGRCTQGDGTSGSAGSCGDLAG